MNDGTARTADGRLFHAHGAATGNKRSRKNKFTANIEIPLHERLTDTNDVYWTRHL